MTWYEPTRLARPAAEVVLLAKVEENGQGMGQEQEQVARKTHFRSEVVEPGR